MEFEAIGGDEGYERGWCTGIQGRGGGGDGLGGSSGCVGVCCVANGHGELSGGEREDRRSPDLDTEKSITKEGAEGDEEYLRECVD